MGVLALRPLLPDQTKPGRDEDGGRQGLGQEA